MFRLWVDDIRPAPDTSYRVAKSVDDAIDIIVEHELMSKIGKDERLRLDFLDLDHDAGDYANRGGDYIKILDWLEETGRNYPIRIHSCNAVGVQNMRAIIQKNGWKEVRDGV